MYRDWMTPIFIDQNYEQCVNIAHEFKVYWINRLQWGWQHVQDEHEGIHRDKQMKFDVLIRNGEMFTILK